MLGKAIIILYYFNLGKIKHNLGENPKTSLKQIPRDFLLASFAKIVSMGCLIWFERFVRVV